MDEYFERCAQVSRDYDAGRITLDQAEQALKDLRAALVEKALLSAALSSDDAQH